MTITCVNITKSLKKVSIKYEMQQFQQTIPPVERGLNVPSESPEKAVVSLPLKVGSSDRNRETQLVSWVEERFEN